MKRQHKKNPIKQQMKLTGRHATDLFSVTMETNATMVTILSKRQQHSWIVTQQIGHKTSKHIREDIVSEIGRLYATRRVARSLIVALDYGTNVCLQNQGTFMGEKVHSILCSLLNGR